MPATLTKAEKNRRRQARFRARGNQIPKTDAQEEFINRISAGESRGDAIASVGRTVNTLDQWLHREPEFRHRYKTAQAKAKGEFHADLVPFDAAWRKRYFRQSTPPHLQRLMDVINEQVAIAAREEAKDRRVLILMPPEHGKSTVGVEQYISYRLAMDSSFKASIVCATQGKARKRLGAIARMLTDRHSYSELIDTYGPFRSESSKDGKPWTADYFMHLRAPAEQRDYSCQALGWTGDIYGDRMDLIVYDDVATLKNQTPAEIEKMWEKTWGEFRSRIRKGGLFIVIGTRMREGDIYSLMEDKGFFTDKVVMPAIAEEPSEDSPGKALWEEQTSLKELLDLRAEDARMFELMYQQNPLPAIGAVFSQPMLESCFDNEHYIGRIPDGCVVVAGIDPSVSNYTAGVVFAVNPRTRHRYLVDVWNEKGLTGEGGDLQAGVVEFICDLCAHYRVRFLAVEKVSWAAYVTESKTLNERLYQLGVSKFGVPVGPASGEAEDHVLAQLSGLFSNSLITLPGSPASRAHDGIREMVHQFLTWKPEKQHWRKAFDILKAFRMAEWAARNQALSPGSFGDIKASDPYRPSYMAKRKVAAVG